MLARTCVLASHLSTVVVLAQALASRQSLRRRRTATCSSAVSAAPGTNHTIDPSPTQRVKAGSQAAGAVQGAGPDPHPSYARHPVAGARRSGASLRAADATQGHWTSAGGSAEGAAAWGAVEGCKTLLAEPAQNSSASEGEIAGGPELSSEQEGYTSAAGHAWSSWVAPNVPAHDVAGGELGSAKGSGCWASVRSSRQRWGTALAEGSRLGSGQHWHSAHAKSAAMGLELGSGCEGSSDMSKRLCAAAPPHAARVLLGEDPRSALVFDVSVSSDAGANTARVRDAQKRAAALAEQLEAILRVRRGGGQLLPGQGPQFKP